MSHLGGVAKSGVRYGQLYADENGILADSVVEPDKLNAVLSARDDVRAIVFVDDFVGSGQSATQAFKELESKCGDQLRDRGLVLVYAVVSGFAESADRITGALLRMKLPIEVHICDPLSQADQCFSNVSMVFENEGDRIAARAIASSHGTRLVKNAPLGFGDSQALVVFEANCPNNTLPILWAERPDWRPLFRRLSL